MRSSSRSTKHGSTIRTATIASTPTVIDLDEEAERLTITLSSSLPVGAPRLHLGFRGVLNDKLKGFYRSTFVDTAGEQQVIATTQFEATDARRAFPCWDEPDLKAVFAITLVVDDRPGGHLERAGDRTHVDATTARSQSSSRTR